MQNLKGGFLAMVLAILGLVLFVTLFNNILTAFIALAAVTNAASYIAFTTVIYIAPTILFLSGVFAAGFVYYKGYKSSQTSGVNGMLMVVLGALEIILFITLFVTMMTSFEILRTNDSIASFTALTTVVQIAPTILLLSGIFAGGMTAYSGAKKMKGGSSKMLG